MISLCSPAGMESASATDIPPLSAPHVIILTAFGLKSLNYLRILTGIYTTINLQSSITGIMRSDA